MKKKTKQKSEAVKAQPVLIEASVKDTPSALILRQMVATANADQQVAALRRVAALAKPETRLALDATHRRALTVAEVIEAQAFKGRKGAPAKRAQAADMRRAVEASITAQMETRSLQASLAEQATLAKGRGEEVEVDAKTGAVRITSHDGLQSASLSSAQALAGRAFRQAYEAAPKGARIARYDDRPKGGQEGADRAALQQSYLMARLAQFERAVGDEVVLQIVRLVAGEGRTIWSLGGSGTAREKATQALYRGLDAIHAVLRVRPHVYGLANRGG